MLKAATKSAFCGVSAANALNAVRPVTASWAAAVARPMSGGLGATCGGNEVVPLPQGKSVDPPPSERLTALARMSFGSPVRARARRKSVSRPSFSVVVAPVYGKWR